MIRQHIWFASVAALTSSSWMALTVIGADLPEQPLPVIQLLTPEFDHQEFVEAPEPAIRSRTIVQPNRPLGLGFPGKVIAQNPRSLTATPSTEIRPVQATEDDSPRIELPIQDAPESDPPPPSHAFERTLKPKETSEPDESAPAPEEQPQPTEWHVIEKNRALMRETSSDLLGASALSPPYLPANQDPDALPWTASFEDCAARAPDAEDLDIQNNDLSTIPAEFIPWWISQLPISIRPEKTALPVDVDSLVTGALQFAPEILGVRTQPDINNSILCPENAAFDWTAFVESKWSDLNDPVGNTLTTGNNSNRFIDQIATSQAGLRRRNEYGGEFEVSQKAGWQDNNSKFFVPAPQGTSRLQLNYTQPLLNGAGVAYNQARIVLAQIELNRSFDVVQEELQNHLVKVTESYWDLYRSRVVYLQRRRVYDRAQGILETLDGRGEVDSLQRQVNRAKAAVASRRSEIIRAQAAIRNAESRLRLLVNDPQFLDLSQLELIPIEPPRPDHLPISLAGSLQQALQYRPDISQAVHDLRAAGVRIGVSQNELLPKFDLVLSSYVAGLEGNAGMLKALGNQYADGRPGYTVGSQFEMPLGNRAAKARLDRRQWELTKAVYDFRTIVETGLTDVELTVREAETSYREMLAKFQALIAAETESGYLEDRWKVLAGGDRGTTLLLEDLLDAQQREADAEGEFVLSQVSYSIALIRVRRAMGVLLIAQNPSRYEEVAAPSSPAEEAPIPSTETQPSSESLNTSASPFPPLSGRTPENRSKDDASSGVPSKTASHPTRRQKGVPASPMGEETRKTQIRNELVSKVTRQFTWA